MMIYEKRIHIKQMTYQLVDIEETPENKKQQKQRKETEMTYNDANKFFPFVNKSEYDGPTGQYTIVYYAQVQYFACICTTFFVFFFFFLIIIINK